MEGTSRDDLARREPLWIALSSLWLDTELSDDDIDAVAAAVRCSGYERGAVEDILGGELAPFLDPNLRSPAGVWSGFEPEWVCAEARARLGGKRPAGRLRVHADWQRVVARAWSSD